MRSGRRQHGFTLIEIMIALVLGLILTGAAISLFIASKQTYRMAEAVARVQEAGRYALEALAQDLRMAGHTGCAPRNQNGAALITATANSVTPGTFPPPPVRMTDSDSDGTVDTLAINYTSGAEIPLANSMGTPAAAVVVQGASVNGDQNVVIADCAQAEVFAITNITGDGSGNQVLAHDGSANRRSGALLKAYQQNEANVMQLVSRTYRVQQTADTNGAGNPIHALMRDGNVILRGVENMQIRFGECVGNQSIAFRPWGSVNDPEAVVAMRVGFLVHSIENVLDSPDDQQYAVLDTTIGPSTTVSHAGDARLRRVFETTVALRNRTVDACHART